MSGKQARTSKKLPFDPIDETARQWSLRWEGVPQMHSVTSLMRVQQLVLGQLDEIHRPAAGRRTRRTTPASRRRAGAPYTPRSPTPDVRS